MSAYEEQLVVVRRQEAIQNELESCGEDMDRMSALLDELQDLSGRAVDLNLKVWSPVGPTPNSHLALIALQQIANRESAQKPVLDLPGPFCA